MVENKENKEKKEKKEKKEIEEIEEIEEINNKKINLYLDILIVLKGGLKKYGR